MQQEGKKKRRTRAEVMLTRPPLTADPNIRAACREYVDRTVEELGGLERIGAGARAMLMVQKVNLATILSLQKGVTMLESEGLPTDSALRTLARLFMTFRQGQVALGLGKARAPRGEALTMADVLDEYQRRKSSSGESA